MPAMQQRLQGKPCEVVAKGIPIGCFLIHARSIQPVTSAGRIGNLSWVPVTSGNLSPPLGTGNLSLVPVTSGGCV
jgi:hypothetical protein